MAIDVGLVDIHYLDRPKEEAVYNFIEALAAGNLDDKEGEVATFATHGSCMGFFMRSGLHKAARQFSSTMTELKVILDWIESLPFKDDYIKLYFNW